jgi:patatin-like phospholipase/acyl hydrolase
MLYFGWRLFLILPFFLTSLLRGAEAGEKGQGFEGSRGFQGDPASSVRHLNQEAERLKEAREGKQKDEGNSKQMGKQLLEPLERTRISSSSSIPSGTQDKKWKEEVTKWPGYEQNKGKIEELGYKRFGIALENAHNKFINSLRNELGEIIGLPQRRIRIFSIDGGGIRGILPAAFLKKLEHALQLSLGNVHIPLAECYDMVCGTSTGGIIALGACVPDDTFDGKLRVKPKYTIQELINLYKTEGKPIFKESERTKTLNPFGLFKTSYKVRNLESILQSYFGGSKLSEAIIHVFVTAYSTDRRRLYLFNREEAIKDKNKDFLLWAVARSTSAAPTFFQSAEVEDIEGNFMNYIDGGVVANNPSLIAYIKAIETYKKDGNNPFISIIALGTGESTKALKKLNQSGKIGWAPEITPLMMEGASRLNEDLLFSLSQSNSGEMWYRRFQASIDKEISAMDKVDKDTIKQLEMAGGRLYEEHAHKEAIDSILDDLKDFCLSGELLKRRLVRHVHPDSSETSLNYSDFTPLQVLDLSCLPLGTFPGNHHNVTELYKVLTHWLVQPEESGGEEESKGKALNLSGSGLTPDDITSLLQLFKPRPGLKKNLAILDLSHNSLISPLSFWMSCARNVKNLIELSGVEKLDLSHTCLNADSLLLLLKSLKDRHLKNLSVYGSNLGEKGLTDLCDFLQKNPFLKYINLAETLELELVDRGKKSKKATIEIKTEEIEKLIEPILKANLPQDPQGRSIYELKKIEVDFEKPQRDIKKDFEGLKRDYGTEKYIAY